MLRSRGFSVDGNTRELVRPDLWRFCSAVDVYLLVQHRLITLKSVVYRFRVVGSRIVFEGVWNRSERGLLGLK